MNSAVYEEESTSLCHHFCNGWYHYCTQSSYNAQTLLTSTHLKSGWEIDYVLPKAVLPHRHYDTPPNDALNSIIKANDKWHHQFDYEMVLTYFAVLLDMIQ